MCPARTAARHRGNGRSSRSASGLCVAVVETAEVRGVDGSEHVLRHHAADDRQGECEDVIETRPIEYGRDPAETHGVRAAGRLVRQSHQFSVDAHW